MRVIIILAVLATAAAESVYVVEKMDMDELVSNLNELKIFTDCLLEKIPCNKVFESYRVITLETIETLCRRCTTHIRHMLWQYLQAIKKDLPDKYVEFRKKYDVHNKYIDVLEKQLNKFENE